jgi:hypothetical protein
VAVAADELLEPGIRAHGTPHARRAIPRRTRPGPMRGGNWADVGGCEASVTHGLFEGLRGRG